MSCSRQQGGGLYCAVAALWAAGAATAACPIDSKFTMPWSATASSSRPCRLGGTNPKYLTPSEVREILRRMWDLNAPILAFIYPTGAQSSRE